MARNDNNVVLENVRVLFPNFLGREDAMNRAGDRNFWAELPPEVDAEQMAKDGWNVKFSVPDDEGNVRPPRIKVKVNFKNRPPRVMLIAGSAKPTLMSEEQIGILDDAEIVNCDIIISPYQWEVRGNTGTTAYLHSAYITIQEDPLMAKYAHLNQGD